MRHALAPENLQQLITEGWVNPVGRYRALLPLDDLRFVPCGLRSKATFRSWPGKRGETLAEICHWNGNIAAKMAERTVCLDVDGQLDQALAHAPWLHDTFAVFRENAPERAKFIIEIDEPIETAKCGPFELLAENMTAIVYGAHPSGATLFNNLKDVQQVTYVQLDDLWRRLTGQWLDETPAAPRIADTAELPEIHDAETLLDLAVAAVDAGQRNAVAMLLTIRLRNMGLNQGEAARILEDYQLAVKGLGDHPYTLMEAMAVVTSIYKRNGAGTLYQCPISSQTIPLHAYLAQFAEAAWRGELPMNSRTKHGDLKVLIEILAIAADAHIWRGLHLPVRRFAHIGITRNKAARAIKRFMRAGILQKEDGARRGRARQYRLGHLAEVSQGECETCAAMGHIEGGLRGEGKSGIEGQYPSICPNTAHIADQALQTLPELRRSDVYVELAERDIFARGAKLDPRCWPSESPAGSFGEVSLRIVAALYHYKPQSMGELTSCCHTSRRTMEGAFRMLAFVGVVAKVVDGRIKRPKLVEGWRDVLDDVEPGITTFGRNVRMQRQYATERVLYHGRWPNGLSKRTVRVAEREKQALEDELRRYTMLREEWCRKRGLPFVPLGPIPKVSERKIYVRVNLRTLAPEREVRPNRRPKDVEVIWRDEDD